MRKPNRGFSLIELLVVISIILVVVAIAIPNFLRSRLAANEASAVGSLRTMFTAASTYSSLFGNGYPPSLGAAGGPDGATQSSCDQALLMDSVLSGGGGAVNQTIKSGYSFHYNPGTPIASTQQPPACTNPGVNSFFLDAEPSSIGVTGERGFLVDESGVIRFTSDGSKPNITSPTIQ